MTAIPKTGLQMRSIIKSSGELELSLAEVAVNQPTGDEVLLRVEGAPLNPTDLGLMFGPTNLSTLASAGGVTTAQIYEKAIKMVSGRLDKSMPIGNEGAGVVVAAGSDPAAQALLGKTVTMMGGAMFSQYRTAKANDVVVLPEGTTATEGASAFVNPLTVLGMIETMRTEGHSALVHTAAASNLGQMLNRLCLKEGIALVNIVRNAKQAQILKDIGAKYVVDSTSPTFRDELIKALIETKATIAFDAIGGGKLANQILMGMEAAASTNGDAFSVYGSSVMKQVYIYGGLDMSPTELSRGYGLTWAVGGWLVMHFLMKQRPEDLQRLKQRVANELKTTFASHYTAEISLAEALQPDAIAKYTKMTTGEKYLINPNKGL